MARTRCRSRTSGVRVDITDKQQEGTSLEVAFHGTLSPIQKSALDALASNDIGVLVAPPGAGKTVIAAALIALRARSTLILVHRLPILEQWRNQLAAFFRIDAREVGQIGGGKREANGRLDVAMLQSLVHVSSVNDIVAQYGQVIVDECHHVSAVGFENYCSMSGGFIASMLANVMCEYSTTWTGKFRCCAECSRDAFGAIARWATIRRNYRSSSRSLAILTTCPMIGTRRLTKRTKDSPSPEEFGTGVPVLGSKCASFDIEISRDSARSANYCRHVLICRLAR